GVAGAVTLSGSASSAPRPRRAWWRLPRAAVGIGLAAGALAALVLKWRLGGAKDPGPPPSSAAAAAELRPTTTAITELPLPPSNSPSAIAAYKAAVQAIRDGNWSDAEESLRRAIAADPAMAAAHLRLSMMLKSEGSTEARASFARALNGRNQLSERDQAL